MASVDHPDVTSRVAKRNERKHARDPVPEGLESPRRQGHRRGDAALHRPAPHPRGHQPPGVRRPPAGGPQGPPGRPDRRDGRPQRPDRGPARHPRADVASAGRDAPGQLPGVRHHPLRRPRRSTGDRPRHRPRAGPDPARHHDRLRRQPHQHPRRVRGARLRDRHQRGRARPGHPDPLARPAAHLLRHRGHRPARPGPGAEGHHPGHHPPDRHRRGHRHTSSNITARPSRPSRWKAG